MISRDLGLLLKSGVAEFWAVVRTDKSLKGSIDSYLRFKRWVGSTGGSSGNGGTAESPYCTPPPHIGEGGCMQAGLSVFPHCPSAPGIPMPVQANA